MSIKHGVIDEFLGADFSAKLLEFALANEDVFEAATIVNADHAVTVKSDYRQAWEYRKNLGDLGTAFREVVTEKLDELFALAGVAPFPDPIIELSLVANRDGCFLTEHVDTLTGERRSFQKSIRVLSTVYYFHRQPAGFSGGQLVINSIDGSEEPIVVEPTHDRIAAFPSFVPHEVLPISVPGDAFTDARFSINCWVKRPVK